MEVKDSGTRQTFDTGGQRDAEEGKGKYVLISPMMVLRLAQLLEKGAIKYDERNWEKGIPDSSYMDSALRHLFKHLEGQRDEDHLAAAIFNTQGLIFNEEMIRRGLLPKNLHNLPNYTIEEIRKIELTAENTKVKMARVELEKGSDTIDLNTQGAAPGDLLPEYPKTGN